MQAGFARVLGFVAVAVLAAAAAWAGESAALPEFTATYNLKHKSGAAGRMQLSLRSDGDEHSYIYESRTWAKGFARLLRRGEIVESSAFRADGNSITPREYVYRDGTRKGKRNSRVEFDWATGSAQATYKGETVELDLQAGTLDRMAIQVAIMRDLDAGREPDRYPLIDRNRLKVYEIEALGEEEAVTPAGRFQALKLRRTREGSSRTVLIWCAAELGYMPVRIEQWKEGKRQTVAELASVGAISPDPAPTPSAR